MTWSPGQRAAQRSLEEPFAGVPSHLAAPLWDWAYPLLASSEQRMRALVIAMRWEIEVRVSYLEDLGDCVSADTLDEVRRKVSEQPTRILDIAEWLLESEWLGSMVKDLDRLLIAGNSAYRVRADGKGLDFRVLPEVRAQVHAAVNMATGSSGSHLATAWNAAYGRNPDPVKAYSEAIKAVEAAAAPVVSPTNGRATLGTILRDIDAKPSKWNFAIHADGDEGVKVVRALMKLLWDGQTSRHGSQTTEPETADAARSAVLLAAALVQFCVDGSFAVAEMS